MMFFNKLRSQVGLALDEAVLVMTMLSGFTGFIVVSSPLDIFGKGVNTTELVSELQEIERANYEFYRSYLSWPHETTNGEWTDNITVLQTPKVMRAYHRDRVHYTYNFLANHERGSTGNIRHEWGDGGDISQHVIEHNGQKYLEIIMENVPYDVAHDIDEKLDGEYGPNSGRVYIIFENEKVNIHYRANRVL